MGMAQEYSRPVRPQVFFLHLCELSSMNHPIFGPYFDAQYVDMRNDTWFEYEYN